MYKLTLAVGSAAIILLAFAGCASAPETAAPGPVPAPASAPVQAAPAPIPPAPAPVPVAAPRRCDAAATLEKDEVFAFDRAELTPAAKTRLDGDVIRKLATCASVEAVVVEGHADRLGSAQYNQKLSERRAGNVKTYLISKGADRARIETLGMGKTVPAKFCPDIKDRKDLIACLAPNRRAIITIKGPGK
jgi:OOP family OmpA-OmpF porin